MDFTETEEMVALRSTVRDVMAPFGGSWYADRAERREDTGEAWRALGQAGFLGVNVPEEYGGGGAGLQELAVVCEESAAVGCPQLLLLVSSAISGEVLTRYGSPEQRNEWLPTMCSGERKMVFAITEPTAGTNTHRITTKAERDGDDWLISGQKYFISGVDEANAVLVVARTGTNTDGQARMSLFIVPTDADGMVAQNLPVSVTVPERQFTLFFDRVRVGPGALIGEEGAGFAQVFHGLNPERIMGAALCVGVARYTLERAVSYANQREVFDGPIGAYQGVAHPLAQARIETDLAALMTQKAAWLHDHGLPAGEASNVAKYAAAEAATSAADQAIQTHGGLGVSTEVGLMPLWGMARLLKIAPVNREMILNFVAHHSMGLPRSY